MKPSLETKNLHGSGVAEVLGDLARLRIAVFREYPYLYEGSVEYEKHYLRTYVDCPDSIVVLALDGGRIVGASTGLPLAAAEADFQKPFREAGEPVESYFYCAESVLLPEYRGRGLGGRFFDEREAHALTIGGIIFSCFCAVQRPASHPLRPAGYRELDPFWSGRGYIKREDLKTAFSWKEIGEEGESLKPMVFWVKTLQ